MPESEIYKIALNSLSAHVAILDEQGIIIETNRAWQNFARANGMEGPVDSVGINYFAVCEQASEEALDAPAVIVRGIRQVMAGEIREFLINYPCHSPTEERWFSLRVVPFREPNSHKVILAHENITPLVLTQRELESREKDLREKKDSLEESNIALKVLLDHRQKDRVQMEEQMLANVRTLILPYVRKLFDVPLPARERTIVKIIEERLEEVIAPFLKRLSSLQVTLTPQEIQVASLVQEGRVSHEIAEILECSISAVDFHRKNIRKKLGLSGSKQNLRSYLLSLRR